MIGKVLGLGRAAREVGEVVGGVAEVFVGNRAERDAGDLERFNRVLAQFGEEFGKSGNGRFDGFVNGLNRLPRPLLAIGTLGLFAYAMVDPHGFATRMQGLAYIPEPLWWLLGAIVSFYFGARELHHYRGRRLELTPPPATPAPKAPAPARSPAPAGAPARPLPVSAEPALETKAMDGPTGQNPAAPAARASASPDFNAAFEEWRTAS
jgi:hypothetical protein